MSGALDQIRERLTQNSTARLEAQRDLLAESSTRARLGGRMFLAGDAVFDTTSGQWGVVVETSSISGAESSSVNVRLESGVVVTRTPNRLMLRPTPPAAEK